MLQIFIEFQEKMTSEKFQIFTNKNVIILNYNDIQDGFIYIILSYTKNGIIKGLSSIKN